MGLFGGSSSSSSSSTSIVEDRRVGAENSQVYSAQGGSLTVMDVPDEAFELSEAALNNQVEVFDRAMTGISNAQYDTAYFMTEALRNTQDFALQTLKSQDEQADRAFSFAQQQTTSESGNIGQDLAKMAIPAAVILGMVWIFGK